jgi:uncharacterized protein
MCVDHPVTTPFPIDGSSGHTFTLVNQTMECELATRVELAITRRDRRRGLLGRDRLDPGVALVLLPCIGVHTAFMRFPIDVVFVNRLGCAIHIVERLKPWRIAIAAGGYGVIELAGGSLARRDLRVGDRVALLRTNDAGAGVPLQIDQVKQCLAHAS